MKSISRNHNFENILNHVQKGKKYFYLWHVKSINPVKINRTQKGDIAFNNEDWNYFISQEAKYYGGVYNETNSF